MIKYTIGLPVIKSKFLAITLESILRQTYKNFNVIIKNNASNSDEINKIYEISKPYIKLSNFQYFESEKKLNISSNFNSILEKVSTEFFMILSDDDILNPFFLEKIDNLSSKYKEIDIFHTRVEIIDECNNLIKITPICPEFESQFDFIYHRLIGQRHQFLSDFVVKTSSLNKIGGFQQMNSGWGLDDITWFKLSEKGVVYTNYLGLKYRSSNLNFTSNTNDIRCRVSDIKLILDLAESELYKNKTNDKNFNKTVIQPALNIFKNKSIEYLLRKKYLHDGFLKYTIFILFQYKKLDINFSNYLKAILMSKKIKL